ncbi:MAG: ABC transporter substrate-binding protein [Eubacteriales bacterium]|nr:ABC transporter substrate-binding protein [Eubacteriales bacterium]
MKNTAGFIRAISMALAAGLALSGCGGDAQPETTATPAPTATATPAPPTAGGELTIPIPANATDLHPLKQNTREMNSLMGLVFESLVSFDSTGAPQASLAEAWELNAETAQWTFTLRANAVWHHNGRAISPQDATFTLDMIREMGAATPYAYVLDTIKEWSVNEAGKLVLTGNTSGYGLLNALSFPVLPADDGYTAAAAPTLMSGTGPYKVTSADLKSQIVLVANEKWWKKQPYLQTIRALPVEDNKTAISALVFSQIDAVQTDDLTVRQYRDSGDAKTYEYTTRRFEFLSINSKTGDLADVKMRKAMAYAVDRSQIVSYVYVNHAIAVESPVPPDSWLYSGNVLTYEQNIDKGRSLILQCGWKDTDADGIWDQAPDGSARKLTFDILVNIDDDASLRRDTALILADQLGKIGMEINVKSVSWDSYKTQLENGTYDLAMAGVYMNPVPDWRYLLRSDGAMNYGKWRIEALDTALDAVQSAPDRDSLKLATDALQTVIMDQLPIIGLYFRTHTLMTATDISGVGAIQEENAFGSIAEWYLAQ